MAKKTRPEPDDLGQSQRFMDVARQLESDETGSLFDQAMKNVKPERPPNPENSAQKTSRKKNSDT